MMKTTTTKTAQFFLDDETVARITFELDSNNQASFSGVVYQLTSYSFNEMLEHMHDLIVDNIVYCTDELEDKSISELAENVTNESLDNIDDICDYMDIDSVIATPAISDDNSFTGFSFISGGQNYNDIEKYNFNKYSTFKALEKEWQALHLSTITDTQATRVIKLMDLLDDTDSDEKAQNLIDNF